MSAFDPKQTFPDRLKRDLDPLIPNQVIVRFGLRHSVDVHARKLSAHAASTLFEPEFA